MHYMCRRLHKCDIHLWICAGNVAGIDAGEYQAIVTVLKIRDSRRQHRADSIRQIHILDLDSATQGG